MISFCKYNFCRDKDSLNPFPTNNIGLKKVKIENGIYDYVDVTRNVNKPYDTNIPKWDFNTILNCDFTNGIYAGNVDFALSQLTAIRIKRRKKEEFELIGNPEVDWVLIKEIPINDIADIKLIVKDFIVPSDEVFEWAIVPVLNDIEGNYIIATLKTKFNGVFIYDTTNNFNLDKGVIYNGTTCNQEIGRFMPLGRKYPILVKNGNMNYDSGSITGMLLGKNYNDTLTINRKEIVKEVNEIKEFLNNGRPKIIKDWNGNIYLVRIDGSPTISYNNNFGMGIANISFSWVEQGKYDNNQDLYENGFIDI